MYQKVQEKTVSKSEIVARMAEIAETDERHGTKVDAKRYLEAFVQVFQEVMEKGEKLTVPNMGTFSLSVQESIVRNAKENKEHGLAKCYRINFKPSRTYKEGLKSANFDLKDGEEVTEQ